MHRAATVVVKHEELAVRVIRLPRVLHRQQVARARWPPATHLEIDSLQPLAKILKRSSTARLTPGRARRRAAAAGAGAAAGVVAGGGAVAARAGGGAVAARAAAATAAAIAASTPPPPPISASSVRA